MPSFTPSPDTFFVEEIAAYAPSWFGEHTFAWIEKRGLTTLDAVAILGRRLDIPPRDIGYAGMKDRHATTRQWISLPRVPPDRAMAAAGDEDERAAGAAAGSVRVLLALRHGNKLRVGHLHGNRFQVVIDHGSGAESDEAEGFLLEEKLARLAASGLPNRYGDQRFGARGDNAARGAALLRGELRERDHRRRRLWLSAAQSAVFNELLGLREERGLLRRALPGDVLQKTDSGGVFVSEDAEGDQRRLDAGEVVVTGPMPGGWAREPPPGSPARSLEDEAFARRGIDRAAFASVGRDLPGARRPLVARVTVPAAGAADHDGGSTRLRFELPAGTYATVVLEHLGVVIATGAP